MAAGCVVWCVCVLGVVGALPTKRVADISSPAPIIGILTQDYDSTRTYIDSGYVKYLEAAGARPVPIFYNQPHTKLTEMFSQINGLLLPGGDMELKAFNSTYMTALFHLVDLATQANKQGDYFPLWGTCMGFQELAVAIAHTPDVLKENSFDSENLPLPLNFTAEAASSRMFGALPKSLFLATATEPITMNTHHDGVLPTAFESNQNLRTATIVLATNYDRKGKPFVSAFETVDLPFFAVQFHPEKNNFDYRGDENMPHTSNAVLLSNILASFFVNEARKNTHKMDYNDLMNKYAIWNFNETYIFPTDPDLLQVYFF